MAPVLRGPGRAPARDHSLAPPWALPGEIPAACTACHAGSEWTGKLSEAWRAFGGKSEAVRRRRKTAEVMAAASSGARGAGSRLGTILRDPAAGWFHRWAAATRASELASASKDTSAARALRAAMDDPNLAVRRAAITGVGAVGSPGDAPVVEKNVDDVDPFIALDAAVSLGRLADPLFRSRLSRVTQRPDLIGEFRAQLALGQSALMTSNWVFAEQALRRALELNPAALHAWNDLGVALSGQQRTEEARKVWSQILETYPGYRAARQNLEDNPEAAPR